MQHPVDLAGEYSPIPGEMSRLIAGKDWSLTPLGPPATWPVSLRTAVNIALASRYPTVIFWGPELRMLFNSAYLPILGFERRMEALGERAEVIAATVWEVARPLLEGALAGRANFAEDLRMDVSRGGQQTESYFTFSYTPLTGDDGRVGGIFCPVVETTQKVIGARRLRALRDLAECKYKRGTQVLDPITSTLARYPDDLPFALTYLASPDGRLVRAGLSGIPAGATWVPATIDPSARSNPWPIAEVLRTGVAANVARHVVGWPADQGGKSPEVARVLPLQGADGRKPSGMMIVGLSPRLRADDEYYGYLDQVAGLVASEEELRGAKQRLESLLENSPLAVIEWSSADYRIVRWSDEATKVFGWTAEETVGRRIDELNWVYPEDWPLVEQMMVEMLSGKRPRNVSKNRNVRKDGSVIHCEWYNSTLHHPDGKFSVLSLVLDVTERKRAEQALERSNLKLAEVLDSIQDDFYVLNRDWKFTFASKRFTSRIGKQPEDFLGHNIWEMFPKHLGTVYEENLRAAMDKRETRRFEIGGQYTDAWYRMTASPSAEGITVLGTEITENKRVEETLRNLNARLVEADARRNEFLGVLSHELRNPLTPVRNSLYILDRATPGGEQARRAHSVIDRQVGHLARLVDDLLDVTRITRGKIRLQRSRVDLVDLVRRAVEDHHTVLENHEVTVDLPTQAIWIDGDPTRLAQLLGNLLNNAAKFTPEDGKISVSLVRDKDSAVLEVADTGLGIDPETLKRLFEPFAQADRSLDRSRGGLGLGLALVKGMVELHGGEVSAHSDGPGKGSRFTVKFPLDEREVVADGPPQPSDAAGRGCRKVLIIEDNKDAADSLSEALGLSGHRVAVAYDGTAGLAMAREFHPEVIICDIGLPGDMDGYAVARALRRDAVTASAFLIALTGYAQPEDQRQALAAGFDAHLAKPPSIEKIKEILGTLEVYS